MSNTANTPDELKAFRDADHGAWRFRIEGPTGLPGALTEDQALEVLTEESRYPDAATAATFLEMAKSRPGHYFAVPAENTYAYTDPLAGEWTLRHHGNEYTAETITRVVRDHNGAPIHLENDEGTVYGWAAIVSMHPGREFADHLHRIREADTQRQTGITPVPDCHFCTNGRELMDGEHCDGCGRTK